MNTGISKVNGVNVKQGNQAKGAFQKITAQQAGLDSQALGDAAGYIYETDQERGFICVMEKNSQASLYSNIMPLSQAQDRVKDQLSRIGTEAD